MDTSKPVPFVTGVMLRNMSISQTFRLVGKAGDISGKGFVLTTSDQVTVHVESDRAPTTDYVEVEGTVTGPASVRAMMVTDFGNDFDLGNYESMVALTRDKYRALFGNKEDCTWRLS